MPVPKTFKNIELDHWIAERSFAGLSSRKNRSNSEQKKVEKSRIALEVQQIKEKQVEQDSTVEQISNFKCSPPGLDMYVG